MCFATHIFDFCRLHNAEYDSIQSFRLLSAHLPSLLLVVESIVNVIPRLQNHSLFSLRMHHLKKIDIDHLLGRTPNELTIDNWQCFFSSRVCVSMPMWQDVFRCSGKKPIMLREGFPKHERCMSYGGYGSKSGYPPARMVYWFTVSYLDVHPVN